jgi:hypothetical protein
VEHNLLMDAIIVENEKFAKQLIAHGADVTFKARASQIHPLLDPTAPLICPPWREGLPSAC